MERSIDIKFEKVSKHHMKIIFEWLAESHMREFWDNSQEHKDDIINFINDRMEPSNYFDGIFTYWIGSIEDKPYAFILTAQVVPNDNLPLIWKDNLSSTGLTYSLDFGIGNKEFLGKGLAAITLQKFTEFFKLHVDNNADTFFIDPDEHNLRARHVYEKAGFHLVGEFKNEGRYWDFPNSGETTYLMVKRL